MDVLTLAVDVIWNMCKLLMKEVVFPLPTRAKRNTISENNFLYILIQDQSLCHGELTDKRAEKEIYL